MRQYLFFNLVLLFLLTSKVESRGQGLSDADPQTTSYSSFLSGRDEGSTDSIEQAYLIYTELEGKRHFLRKNGIEILRVLDRQYAIARIGDSNILHKRYTGSVKVWPVNNIWKLSERLMQVGREDWQLNEILNVSLTVEVNKYQSFKNRIASHGASAVILQEYPGSGSVIVRSNYQFVYDHIIGFPEVLSIQEVSLKVDEEATLSDYNLSVNAVNLLKHEHADLQGNGSVVSIKEQKYDSTDIDFKGRHVSTGGASPFISRHATEMATIVAGGGNSSERAEGVAKAALLASSDFEYLFPDPDQYYRQYGIAVQNHSYGTVIENFYGALARSYDVNANSNPHLLHVFSAGNEGMVADTTGPYKGIVGFANLTGNFKMAKNILTVGSIDQVKNVEAMVSKGPAYDGRVKPELVAYSASGSSGAAALVSGVSVLLQEFYHKRYDEKPSSALIKAALINSAEDVGSPGIDYASGYGNVQAHIAFNNLSKEQFYQQTLSQDESRQFEITLPAKSRNLKVTLVWNDPAAEGNAALALVNDLDLVIENPHGLQYQPWVLNSHPHADSLVMPAIRKADHLNNIEQVGIADPDPGKYTITVQGFDVPVADQTFSVVYDWELENEFTWTYPTGSDNMPLLGTSANYFRWKSSYKEEKGQLSYTVDGGETWVIIEDNLELKACYYGWEPPDLFSIAAARMVVGVDTFMTEPFTISRPIPMSVGFNCADSVMLVWNRVSAAKSYTLHEMGDRYLFSSIVTEDTFAIVKKKETDQRLFALSPTLADATTGARTLTYNSNLQGVDCYLISLLANVIQETEIGLDLQLGTNYQVASVSFYRLEGADTVALGTLEKIPANRISFIDVSPTQGQNFYFAQIKFFNGTSIFTQQASAFFLTDDAVIIFPNPVVNSSTLQVYTKYLDGKQAVMLLYNAKGQLVKRFKLATEREHFPLGAVVAGIYYYKVVGDGLRKSGKLIVK